MGEACLLFSRYLLHRIAKPELERSLVKTLFWRSISLAFAVRDPRSLWKQTSRSWRQHPSLAPLP